MPDDGRLPPAAGPAVIIREALPTDVDALALLEADRFASDRLSRRSLLGLIRSRSACVLLASRKGRTVGYAVVLLRRGCRSARLYSIAVAAEEAGRGIGSRLLAAAESAARVRGAGRMHLEVREDNPDAVKLYQRAGFHPAGRRSDYYEDGMAALLFARDLAGPAAITPRPRAA